MAKRRQAAVQPLAATVESDVDCGLSQASTGSQDVATVSLSAATEAAAAGA